MQSISLWKASIERWNPFHGPTLKTPWVALADQRRMSAIRETLSAPLFHAGIQLGWSRFYRAGANALLWFQRGPDLAVATSPRVIELCFAAQR